MSQSISHLASLPLDQLLPQAIERLRGATLDELAAILGQLPSAPAASGTRASGGSGDALARAILALPDKGSKLGAAERAVVLHALDVSDNNVSAAARLLGVNRKALERKIRRIRRSK